jgi:hypothetical protein
LGKHTVEVVRLSSVMHISPKAGVLPGQVKAFEDHACDRCFAQHVIEIHMEAFFDLIEEYPPPRHLVIFLAREMRMAPLYYRPMRCVSGWASPTMPVSPGSMPARGVTTKVHTVGATPL